MGIIIKHSGSFKNTESFFKKVQQLKIERILKKYGERGVLALSAATPTDSGLTSESWDYTIETTRSGYTLSWENQNVHNGVNVAIILQTGHGTGTGGYVRGRDYINPAIQPIFDQLANEAWREVTKV